MKSPAGLIHSGLQNPISERWNSEEQLVLWREAWANAVNRSLERYGLDERVDHRSHAARGLMQLIIDYFSVMYEKAKQDGTVRTDIPAEEMLSATIHLMLAVVTRYAVGLVYQPEGGFDAIKELEIQKRMLYQEYTTQR